MAPLIFDQAGNLFGTTSIGGKYYGMGTVFELSPPSNPGEPWIEAQIHDFHPATDGSLPEAGLTPGPGGVFFGTASVAGPHGRGTVFGLAPPSSPGEPWGFAVLHSFNNVSDGGSPGAGLTPGGPNTFYGTAGVVFQLVYSGGVWTETVLYNFDLGPGSNTGVILYKDGLYGTTSKGGYKNQGTVFRLSH
ncbi:MAG: choice-of-anchor tandem repeat GloVer-containing protein [Terriglobales bacterium]